MAKNPTVLLVDENQIAQETLKRELAALGLVVIPASTTAEAWEIFESGPKPDILVLNFLLPGRTGPDLNLRVQGDPRFKNLLVIPFIDEGKYPSQTVVTKFGSSREAHAEAIHSSISKDGKKDTPEPSELILRITNILINDGVNVPPDLLKAYEKILDDLLR